MSMHQTSNPTHELIQTRNGVWAIRSLQAGEVMHPGVGPLVEAEALYVQQSHLIDRLQAKDNATITVFDIGLGAGANALAAWHASEHAPTMSAKLHLVSFERDLQALELAQAHGHLFAIKDHAATAVRTLLATGQYETSRTLWRLAQGDILESLDHEVAFADIVFWDPFSPHANPLLWTVAAFTAIRRKANPRCTLFTYSASTATRIALLLAGWFVGVGDATGSKAKTTAAACDLADLVRPLDGRWLLRLQRPDVPLPTDAPCHFLEIISNLPQFTS